MKISLLLLALLSILTFESCDNTPLPTINLMSPEEGTELYAGSGVHFVAELSDSIMLSSYTIELLANDGDEYSKSRNPEKTDKHIFLGTWDLAEKFVALHHHEILIPEDAAAGDYYFVIRCKNTAGKEAYEVNNVKLVR